MDMAVFRILLLELISIAAISPAGEFAILARRQNLMHERVLQCNATRSLQFMKLICGLFIKSVWKESNEEDIRPNRKRRLRIDNKN
jgi:hypothetical protein